MNRIERLEAAIEQAAKWFDEYVAIHRAKENEPAARDKIIRNQERASWLRAEAAKK